MHICKDHLQTTPGVGQQNVDGGKKLFMTVWLLSFFSSKIYCLRKYFTQISDKWYKTWSCLCLYIKWLWRESFQSSKQLLILHRVKIKSSLWGPLKISISDARYVDQTWDKLATKFLLFFANVLSGNKNICHYESQRKW